MPALRVVCTGGFAPSEDRGVTQYARSPSEGTTPSSTDNALPKDLRRAYLELAEQICFSIAMIDIKLRNTSELELYAPQTSEADFDDYYVGLD